MALPSPVKRLTYEEWLRLPETNQPCEVIDGELVMSPAPGYVHQHIVLRTSIALQNAIPSQRGMVLLAPVDVIIRREPLRTRQPDVMVVLFGEDGWHNAREVYTAPHGSVVPDLAVEVFSSDQTRLSLQSKLEDYRQAGVRECWLVSPEAETVEVLRLSPQGIERIGLYGRGDTVRSEVLPELQIPTDSLFEQGEQSS